MKPYNPFEEHEDAPRDDFPLGWIVVGAAIVLLGWWLKRPAVAP